MASVTEVKAAKYHIVGQGVCIFLIKDAVTPPLATAQLKISGRLRETKRYGFTKRVLE